MLERHPRDKFLVFTESLQTCEIICKRFGDTATRRLVGSMSEADRERAVRDLRSSPNVRILVATSAADEGFDFWNDVGGGVAFAEGNDEDIADRAHDCGAADRATAAGEAPLAGKTRALDLTCAPPARSFPRKA